VIIMTAPAYNKIDPYSKAVLDQAESFPVMLRTLSIAMSDNVKSIKTTLSHAQDIQKNTSRLRGKNITISIDRQVDLETSLKESRSLAKKIYKQAKKTNTGRFWVITKANKIAGFALKILKCLKSIKRNLSFCFSATKAETKMYKNQDNEVTLKETEWGVVEKAFNDEPKISDFSENLLKNYKSVLSA